MARFFREFRKDEVPKIKKDYEEAGYSIRVFPLRERGLNQTNFRKLEFQPPGNLADQLGAIKKLRQKGYKT